jgi:hypothetical protein
MFFDTKGESEVTAPYRLDHERVQAERRRFYENRRRHTSSGHHCCLSFEELFELTQDYRNTLKDIAAKAGIQLASMMMLYERYFMQFCDNLSPQERRDAFFAQKRKERTRARYTELPDRPWIPTLVDQAQKAGLAVRPCFGSDKFGRVRLLTTKVKVGADICAVHPITGARKRQGNRHVRYRPMILKRTVLENPIHLCPILIPGWRESTLIFPSDYLRNFFGPHDEKIYVFIPFRLHGTSVQKIRSPFRPWDFENRWDLIEKHT